MFAELKDPVRDWLRAYGIEVPTAPPVLPNPRGRRRQVPGADRHPMERPGGPRRRRRQHPAAAWLKQPVAMRSSSMQTTVSSQAPRAARSRQVGTTCETRWGRARGALIAHLALLHPGERTGDPALRTGVRRSARPPLRRKTMATTTPTIRSPSRIRRCACSRSESSPGRARSHCSHPQTIRRHIQGDQASEALATDGIGSKHGPSGAALAQPPGYRRAPRWIDRAH